MKKLFLRLFTYFVIVFPVIAVAQEAPYGALGLRRIYKSTLINPVLIPDSTSVENSLSLIPFVPASVFDMSVKADAGSMRLGGITSSISNGTLDINALVNTMDGSKKANLYMGMSMSMIHVYLKVGNNSSRIEFSQRLKFSANTNALNKSTIAPFMNENNETNTFVDMTDTRFSTMAWNEMALGYTTPIGKKMNIGARFKYLTGVAFADFSSNTLTAQLGPAGNTFNIDSRVRTASLKRLSKSEVKSTVKGESSSYSDANEMTAMLLDGLGRNNGLAVDFGLSYQLDKKLNVFAGVNDLGAIVWRNNPLVYTNKAVVVDFNPLYINQNTNQYEVDFSGFYENGVVATESFTTMLNAHFNTGAAWKLSKWFHSTALLDGYLVNGKFAYPGATLAGTVNGGKFSEFTINGGYTKDRPLRVGAGMSMKFAALQLHVFSNNVHGFIDPTYLQSADIQFGLSWVWRNKAKKVS